MFKQGAKLDMTFDSFFEVYEVDKKQRVKESTWESKSHVVRTKILPYFGSRKIAEIEAKDVIAWQNELMAYRDKKGKRYSADYLKTIHAQLTAIFNHAQARIRTAIFKKPLYLYHHFRTLCLRPR